MLASCLVTQGLLYGRTYDISNGKETDLRLILTYLLKDIPAMLLQIDLKRQKKKKLKH